MVNKNIYGDIYIFNWNVLYTRQTVWAQVSNEKKLHFSRFIAVKTKLEYM